MFQDRIKMTGPREWDWKEYFMHLRFDGASDVRSGLCKVPCHGKELEHRARDGLLGLGHNCWSALLHHIKGEVSLEVKAEAEIHYKWYCYFCCFISEAGD